MPATAREDLRLPLNPKVRVQSSPPKHRLEWIVGDQAVSWLTIIDFQQQIGPAFVRMGGMAGVGTDPAHRMRGYSRQLIHNAFRWMYQTGFDTSTLQGIVNFYPKFGYAQAFPDTRFSVTVRDAEKVAPTGLRLVGFAEKFIPAVLELFHRNNAGRTGIVRRDRKTWQPFRHGMGFGMRLVPQILLDRRSRFAGYIAFADDDAATVAEAECVSPAMLGDLVHAAAQWGIDRRMEKIQFILPEDHPLTEFCKPSGMRIEKEYRTDGRGMVRLINTATTLARMREHLGERMQTARPGSMTIQTNLDAVTLRWNRGKIQIGNRSSVPSVHLPQWAMAQLVYGYRGASAFAAEGLLRGPQSVITTLDRLFPVHPHFFYPVDDF